jgi:hypothetical protein
MDRAEMVIFTLKTGLNSERFSRQNGVTTFPSCSLVGTEELALFTILHFLCKL